MRVKLNILKNWDNLEYMVTWRWLEPPELDEDKTYYTEDLEDARDTLKVTYAEALSSGHTVSIGSNKWTRPVLEELGIT